MLGCLDGRLDEWTDTRMDGFLDDRWMTGCLDERMRADAWMDGLRWVDMDRDGWMDG